MLPHHPKVDRLAALLQRFDVAVLPLQETPGSGLGATDTAPGARAATAGMLYVCRSAAGACRMAQAPSADIEAPGPPMLVYLPHGLSSAQPDRALPPDRLAFRVDLGTARDNPLVRALPEQLEVFHVQSPAMAATCALIWAEADAARCGHHSVLQRFAQALVVQLLRFALEQRLVDTGLLGGLSDARLARALAALHADPARAWSLPLMAEAAAMSRSRFAAHFAAVVGQTPGDYLTEWRMGLARTLLCQGVSLKQVADEVGYASASALTRAFVRSVGATPTAWARGQQNAGRPGPAALSTAMPGPPHAMH